MTSLTERASGGGAYRTGVAIALATSFLMVWTTIVRDDGNGIGFFMVIIAAAVGGFAASFRPAGLARTMVGVAVMQALLGIAIAAAPTVAAVPDGSLRALAYSGFFVVLWLVAGAFFHAAARSGRHE